MKTIFSSESPSIQIQENGWETNIMPPVPGGAAPTIPMKEDRSDASQWREKYQIIKKRAYFWVPYQKVIADIHFFLGPFLSRPHRRSRVPHQGGPGGYYAHVHSEAVIALWCCVLSVLRTKISSTKPPTHPGADPENTQNDQKS